MMDTSGTGKDTSLSSGTGTASASGGSLFVRPESPHHYSSVSPCLGSGSYTYSSFQPNAHYTEISNSTIDSNSCKLAEMTIERCKVRLQSIILEGTFAKIYKGTVLERDGSEEKVVVKTVIVHLKFTCHKAENNDSKERPCLPKNNSVNQLAYILL
ncbi:Tyrosine-protein kinase Dnt [Orchesella cincta]|uniref:Tyrosine-protein kinase Dnt n=1 Tax=Orchesella cincta TaxID=48709 RepID=A0A1D2NCG4_ORCCI|nr:Tyrosine-protein kinase Dnt [Orchesella cincta]